MAEYANAETEPFISAMPDYAAKYARPAFAGDTDAGMNLFLALSDHDGTRADLVYLMHFEALANPDLNDAARVVFRQVWSKEHRALGGWDRDLLHDVIDRRGTRPSGLSECQSVVTVYRGGRGSKKFVLSQELGMSGLSWTTDRSVAAFFSWRPRMRASREQKKAIVLKATIPWSWVQHVDDGRNESEVLITEMPARRVQIDDGTPSDWRALADEYSRRVHEDREDDAVGPTYAAAAAAVAGECPWAAENDAAIEEVARRLRIGAANGGGRE